MPQLGPGPTLSPGRNPADPWASMREDMVTEAVDRVRAEILSTFLGELRAALANLQVNVPTPQVHAHMPSPPTPDITVNVPEPPENEPIDVTVNLDGINTLTKEIQTTNALLLQLITLARAPVETTVHRGGTGNFIQSTTQQRKG